MVQYKLTYMNLRGRAELARWLFAVAGQEYEDHRFEREEIAKYKPNLPFGQVPLLEVTDGAHTFKVSQSLAIARYLARTFNLAGKTAQEQAQVDMYADQISDVVAEMVKGHLEKDEAKKAEINAKLATEILPTNMGFFEAKLASSTSGFFFDSGLTWLDLYLVVILEWLKDKKEALLAHFPRVRILEEKVLAHPKLAEWIAKRPQTEY